MCLPSALVEIDGKVVAATLLPNTDIIGFCVLQVVKDNPSAVRFGFSAGRSDGERLIEEGVRVPQ